MKRMVAVVAIVGVVAGACGGGGEAASETTEPASAPASTTATTSVPSTTAQPDLGDDGELTLDDFLPGFAADDFDAGDWRSQEMQVQQQVAECMAAEGFDYIPFVPSEDSFFFTNFDEEEYVKEFGFGVSTWVLQQETFDPESDPMADDPNREIVEAMDELERDEYDRVLHGSEPPIIAETPEEELAAMTPEEQVAFYEEAYADWEPNGCYSDAWESVSGFGDGDAFFEEFGDDLEAAFERAQSDPRIVDLQADWSACMADRGHDYATQEDMYAYFYGDETGESEFSRRVNELITFPEPDPSLFEEPVEGEEPTFDPGLFGPQYDLEELQPLIDEEIAVATANYDCSRDMEDVWEEVYAELERQFIDENRERLLAYQGANG